MRGRLSATVVLALVAGLGAGCAQAKKVESAAPPSAVPVRVAQVVRKNLPVVVEAIGTGEAYSNVQVESLVTGELTGVYFKQGDFVRKGQLLFTIDPQPFQATLNQAQSDLARDLSQEKIAVLTAKRYKTLLDQGIIPRQQYDQYEATAESAKATVQADRAAVASAKLQLSYCKIYAPMDGKTGGLGVFPGSLVKANTTPVFVTLNQINPIYIDFAVPENLLPQVRQALAAHAPVRAYTQSDSTHAEIGHLSFVDNTVDATTGTIKLKGTFANVDHRLWPGEFVTVDLRLGEEANAIIVPSLALQTSQQGSFVWVVDKNHRAEMKTVTVKRQQQGQAVIAAGLSPGETVVTEGQLRLVPGARVEIRTSL